MLDDLSNEEKRYAMIEDLIAFIVEGTKHFIQVLIGKQSVKIGVAQVLTY